MFAIWMRWPTYCQWIIDAQCISLGCVRLVSDHSQVSWFSNTDRTEPCLYNAGSQNLCFSVTDVDHAKRVIEAINKQKRI